MIEVSNISKSYGSKQILTDISFQVNPGERVAIIGKNGCGKSTLLQILAGVSKPDKGTISYFGQNPMANAKLFRTLCGYVPQENPLLDELTVYDNLRLYGADKKDLNNEMLMRFALQDILHTSVGKLSGGMKRRVSIACSVYYMPAVLFMDEPTTALDIYYKSTIHEWMEYYKGMNGILVITSHDEQEILACDRCFLMTKGKLRELSEEERNESGIRKLIIMS